MTHIEKNYGEVLYLSDVSANIMPGFMLEVEWEEKTSCISKKQICAS